MKNIFILLSLAGFGNAQTNPSWEPASKEELVSAYQKVCDWFVKTQNYAFHLKYTSFKDHLSNEIIEESQGFYKRMGEKYRTEAVGMKTIQNEKIRIVIDTADRIIALTNPGTLNPTQTETKDLLQMLENVKSLKKKKQNKNTTYRIDFLKNEMYEAYEFTVNEKGLLEKLVYFYSEQTEKDYGDGENEKPREIKIKPRMEIVFSSYQVPSKFSEGDFTEKNIVMADNRKISLLSKYKGYQLKDYRYQEKK